jgi:hypothetical protein
MCFESFGIFFLEFRDLDGTRDKFIDLKYTLRDYGLLVYFTPREAKATMWHPSSPVTLVWERCDHASYRSTVNTTDSTSGML